MRNLITPYRETYKSIFKKKDHIKYAVICDAGIYIINMKDLSTPEKNILYRRNNTREHNILINPLQAIVLEYPECNALFVFSAANSKISLTTNCWKDLTSCTANRKKTAIKFNNNYKKLSEISG